MRADDRISVTRAGDCVEVSADPPGTVRPSTLVCYAVAAAELRDPLVLPSLQETIDPDALDAVFDCEATSDADTACPSHTLRFRYGGRRVTVRCPNGTPVVTVRHPGLDEEHAVDRRSRLTGAVWPAVPDRVRRRRDPRERR